MMLALWGVVLVMLLAQNSLDAADHQVHRSFRHEEHAPDRPEALGRVALLGICIPEDHRLTLIGVTAREEFA